MVDEVGLDRNTGGFAALLGSFWDATAGKFFTRRIRATDDGALYAGIKFVGQNGAAHNRRAASLVGGNRQKFTWTSGQNIRQIQVAVIPEPGCPAPAHDLAVIAVKDATYDAAADTMLAQAGSEADDVIYDIYEVGMNEMEGVNANDSTLPSLQRFDFKQLSGVLSVSGINLQAIAATKKYVRASGSFVTDGYAPGQWTKVAGFANAANNGWHQIQAITTTTIADDTLVVAETLVDEASGAGRTISPPKVTVVVLATAGG